MADPRDPAVGPGTRALVVGEGLSGAAARDVLVAVGAQVRVVPDDRVAPPRDLLVDVDLVVPSPGVPPHSPLLAAAEQRGVRVWSEPEIGHRLHPRRVIGVTGTNGKTTVTELVAAMLAESGIPAVACGNIGRPFSTAAREAAADAWLVAELSSFQLHFAHRLRARVAVLTNLAADHLDWHGDAAAYGAAKARLWAAQEPGDRVVAVMDDPGAAALVEGLARGRLVEVRTAARPGEGVTVTPDAVVARVDGAATTVVRRAELPTAAPHHATNVACAAAAALLAGADVTAVGRVARGRGPGRHRMELVAEAGGVRWVDDSKATNAHAAAAALRGLDDVVWIAGGLAKGVDLGVLADDLSSVRHALLIGTDAPAIAAVCRAAGVAADDVGDLATAVARAGTLARPGTTVLLSPACASFDQFRDYADRGEQFARLAAARAEAGAHP